MSIIKEITFALTVLIKEPNHELRRLKKKQRIYNYNNSECSLFLSTLNNI